MEATQDDADWAASRVMNILHNVNDDYDDNDH